MPRETGWKLSIPAEISRWRLGWRSAGAALHAGPHFAVGVRRDGALSGQRGQPGDPELRTLLLLCMLLRHRVRRWTACSGRRRGPNITLATLHARQTSVGWSQVPPWHPQRCPGAAIVACAAALTAVQNRVGGKEASSTGSRSPGNTLGMAWAWQQSSQQRCARSRWPIVCMWPRNAGEPGKAAPSPQQLCWWYVC